MSGDMPAQERAGLALALVQHAAPRLRMPWHARLRDLLSSYLPLMLMAVLALATWWLVKNSPRASGPVDQPVVSAEPDYTMSKFAIERFDATGRLKLRIEGDQLRHFPAFDRVEIQEARIRAIAPDGRVTLARALRAVGNGDGSEVQLIGEAEVRSEYRDGQTLRVRGEFLQAYFVTERVRSDRPVRVTLGGNEFKAAGLEYDNVAQRLDLKGPMRADLPPRPGRPSR
jgi:lipopolysaccharide export system protein LptC